VHSELGIAHRDIKPQNIVCTLKQDLIKLIDFGVSEKVGENNTMVGTIKYHPPEIYKEGPIDGTKADIWAAGCVIYYTCTGEYFCQGSNKEEVKRWLLEGYVSLTNPRKFPDLDQAIISPKLIQLLKLCLKKDPDDRASIIQIYETCKWLSD